MIQPQEATEKGLGKLDTSWEWVSFSLYSSFDGFLFGHFQYQEYNFFFLITTPSFVGRFLWLNGYIVIILTPKVECKLKVKGISIFFSSVNLSAGKKITL